MKDASVTKKGPKEAQATSYCTKFVRRKTIGKWRKQTQNYFWTSWTSMLEVKQLCVNRNQSKSGSGASRCSDNELKKLPSPCLSDPNNQNKKGKNKKKTSRTFDFFSFLFPSVWLFAAPSRTWQAAASRSVVLMSHLSQQDPSACRRSKRDRLFELCR